MDITWKTYDHGREGELNKLNAVRNDHNKPGFIRKQADEAHAKIVNQLKDKKLMAMRHRLIAASLAGDEQEINKISRAMKAHTKEDRETGLYD